MTATLTVDGIHSLMLKAGHRMPPSGRGRAWQAGLQRGLGPASRAHRSVRPCRRLDHPRFGQADKPAGFDYAVEGSQPTLALPGRVRHYAAPELEGARSPSRLSYW